MKNNGEDHNVCMDLPEGGIEPVTMVSITFAGEGQIVVSNTQVLKCKEVEGNIQCNTVHNQNRHMIYCNSMHGS